MGPVRSLIPLLLVACASAELADDATVDAFGAVATGGQPPGAASSADAFVPREAAVSPPADASVPRLPDASVPPPPPRDAATPPPADMAVPDVEVSEAELCNGRDDDCDGQIDEGVKTAFYADADLDGHGATGAAAVLACAPPAAHAAVDDDCDDTDPTVHPNAREVCDGQDNRCTGSPTFHEGGNSCGSATLGLQRNGTLYLASTSRLDRAAASSFCANRGYTLWVPGDFGEWISVQAAFQVPSTGQATLQLGLDVPYHVGAQTQCGSSGSGLRDHDDRTGACSAGAPAWLSAQGIDTSGLSPSYAGPRYVQKASAPLATFAYATGLATAYAVCSN